MSQPTLEPVSLAEAKSHLRIDGTYDDTLIGLCIGAARQYFENSCQIHIAQKTVQLVLDSFPATVPNLTVTSNINYPFQTKYYPFDGTIYLTGPVQSVESVSYTDTALTEQSLTGYRVDLISSPARITYAYTWPTTAKITNSVRVNYTAGFTTVNMPKLLKSGMLFYVGHLYENREGVVTGTIATDIPLAVESIIQQYSSGVYH
jgi:hypothetical protein